MTSKHWTLVGGAVACLASMLTPPLAAAPWVGPGDARARSEAQQSADLGLVNRTFTTWPVMWVNLPGAKGGARLKRGSPYLAFEYQQAGLPSSSAAVVIGGQNEAPFVTGFEKAIGGTGRVGVTAEWQGHGWALGLSGSGVIDPDDNQQVQADGSYVAKSLGNWVVGAGQIDRWWGPGWHSSLILSNNARPIPGIWLNRKIATESASPWLSWAGPWDFTLLGGQLEGKRAQPEAKILGMRLTLRPFQGLDVGFSRVMMFGGRQRSEGASTVLDALIGRDNSQDGADDDPGNQLASIDVRYGFALGDHTLGVYTEVLGEDEAGLLPAKKSWLFGADATSALWGGQQQWFVEHINTVANDLDGNSVPNVTYEHFQYRSGYNHFGRAIGASFGGDTRATTLGGYHFFQGGGTLSVSVSYADLNVDDNPRVQVPGDDIFYFAPAERSTAAFVSIGYGTHFLSGWLDLNAQGSNQKTDFVSGARDRWSLSGEWTYRF